MQTLRNLIFKVSIERNGKATLSAALSGSLHGVSGEVSVAELETLVSYLAATAQRVRTTLEQNKNKETPV